MGAVTSQIISARASLFVDFAIFHYELDVFEQANICAIIKYGARRLSRPRKGMMWNIPWNRLCSRT